MKISGTAAKAVPDIYRFSAVPDNHRVLDSLRILATALLILLTRTARTWIITSNLLTLNNSSRKL